LARAQTIKKKGGENPPPFRFNSAFLGYLPLAFAGLEVLLLLLAGLEVVFAPLFAAPPADLEVLPPVLAAGELPLLVAAVTVTLAVFAAAFGFAAFALPAADAPPLLAFAEALFSPLPIRSLTASAATFKALTAAPVAAPIRISPATSLAVSKTGDEDFFVDFFVEDFAEVEAFGLDFAGAEVFFAADFDFAGAALFAVDF
jgi:hypothetical protein